jgi:EAL domain-containing protein (putative c-di-GMP-specific phosphodiesterase class I)
VAHISDDGYGCLVPGLDEAAAESLAERIRAEVRLPQVRSGKTRVEADCDVGYVIVAGRSANPVDLLDEVYRAGHGANAPGQGKVAVIQKATSLAARDKQPAEEGDSAMLGKLEYALANDRFLLVYQPIISLMGDNQENYSVLVRVIDEAENLLEANEFIGAGIRSGLIERIDKWAIRSACRAMSDHRKAGHRLNFFINLAEDTFRDPGIIIWICDCLREFDVRGSWLTFVIQEELVDGNLGSLSRLIESLKKIKCRVAVNRFGASERPQMLFQGLSLDFVLLLPDFARGLADDKDKQQRLLALANLSREFNVKSVVTGVEDARALTILWTAGVDYVQGNFLQRASPTLEISA